MRGVVKTAPQKISWLPLVATWRYFRVPREKLDLAKASKVRLPGLASLRTGGHRPTQREGWRVCVCKSLIEKVVNEFDFLINELYKLFYKRSNNMQDQETDILSARESRIAVALFEIMKPQIEKLIINKVALHLDNIEDEKSKEFDIHDYTGDIEDIVGDWVRYNVTITSTID